LAIACNQHEVRENVLLRSGCFPHIRLALIQALCTSRHNRRELRLCGVIPHLIMMLSPGLPAQQQAGSVAALLALMQGDCVGCCKTPANACNVPNLQILADHPDAVARLEAIASGRKTSESCQIGAPINGCKGDAERSCTDAMQDCAASPASVSAEVCHAAFITEHTNFSSSDSCCTKSIAVDSVADVSSALPVLASAPMCRDLVECAPSSPASADAVAILSLIRFTLPQSIADRIKRGIAVHSDPDALAPPPPGESSGASHTSRLTCIEKYAATLLHAIVFLLLMPPFLPSPPVLLPQRWLKATT
jgi:hypothetical protein